MTKIEVPSFVIWTIVIAMISSSGTAIWSSARVVTQLEYVLKEINRIDKQVDKNTDRIFQMTKN